MGPNSAALLLDENAPIVWLVQTDGGGYLTATPFSITPYQPKPQIDINSLEERISKLERYYESNSTNNKQSRKQKQPASAPEYSDLSIGSANGSTT